MTEVGGISMAPSSVVSSRVVPLGSSNAWGDREQHREPEHRSVRVEADVSMNGRLRPRARDATLAGVSVADFIEQAANS